MDGKALVRLVAIVIVAVAGTAAAIFVARDNGPSPSVVTSSAVSTPPLDSLHATLLHCAELGEAAVHDSDCLAAWAENRRRFLGADEAH
jgi:conjugative transfer region protein TrbK